MSAVPRKIQNKSHNVYQAVSFPFRINPKRSLSIVNVLLEMWKVFPAAIALLDIDTLHTHIQTHLDFERYWCPYGTCASPLLSLPERLSNFVVDIGFLRDLPYTTFMELSGFGFARIYIYIYKTYSNSKKITIARKYNKAIARKQTYIAIARKYNKKI